jgi:hypothetical protein
MLDAVKRIFRAAPASRRTPTQPQTALSFVVSLSTRLLLSISPDSAAPNEAFGQKLIGTTRNISESSLVVVVPTLQAGQHIISESSEVRVALDLHPLGLVEMNCLVVLLNEQIEGEGPDYLLSLKIRKMSTKDRALYIEYLGTYGWEKVSAGNNNT